MVGSIYYNCALSVYYVCVIKFSMSEVTFKRKIEPFCHIIPNVYAIAGASYLLAGQYFNSMGPVGCWINAVPPNCINDPEVECIRGDEMVSKYRRWFFGYSVYATFTIIAINMFLIVWTVFMQKKKSDEYRFGSSGASDNGGRCFPCKWSIFSSRDVSVAEKERGVGTNCAVIDEKDVENPHHRHLVPLEDCLQSVKSPKVSASLTSRPGPSITHKSRAPAGKSFAIFGAEDEEVEGTDLASSFRSAGSRRLSAPPSRAGNAKDPYAFNLKKVRVELRDEARRASMSHIQSIWKVASPVDVTGTLLRSMAARPTPGNVDPPVTDGTRDDGAQGRGRSLSQRTSRNSIIRQSERRKVVIQGSLYLGAFSITWIWPAVIQ